ncbi:ABC transporter permease [Sporohalobacter salinus]|uniref:ABC transporter permease n=1 Tax=Sporohalobacter salinus TaxID=1494606 RepID=UPI001EF9A02F|nr:FtsX-like permease family protein [Sporohalobacter salinus]MBM7624602.1 putative ABC transport system permease protein [Sporohalobacter salinus]
MFFIRLALKNLTRHKRRVLVTASIIALGIAIFLIYDSIQLGINKLSFNNIKNLETGDLQVVNEEYWAKQEELPLEDFIYQDQELLQIIKEISYFKALSLQLKFSANLNNGIDELPVIACGIKPQQHKRVFTTEQYLIKGRMIKDGKYEAVFGKRLADLMELEVGDYFTLLFRTPDDSFNTIDAEIVGLLHTNNPEVNNNLIYIPLEIAQQALNLNNKVSQVVVKLNRDEKAVEITEKLSKELTSYNQNLTAHSWRDSAGEVIAMSKVETIEKSIMMSVILLIAAVGIVNTIILSSLERTKEIGMMKALGLREREIILTFMVEAMGIGLIGGIIGSVMGSMVIFYLNIEGLNLSVFGGVEDWGLPIMGKLYGYWNPSAFLFVISFGIIVSLLASILPARWAARKDPVEAIYDR